MATNTLHDKAITAALAENADWHRDFYLDLHQHPELSFAETRTSGRVADRLDELGFDEVHTRIGRTGVVGVLRNGDGPTVLARADMDALPVKEVDGEHASTATATDRDGNEVPVMHACGHDTHITSLLAASQVLAEHRDAWSGTLISLFQPAEEVAGGARAMVEDGLVDLIDRPDVALGQHVMGLPHDVVAVRPGPAFSAADSIRITVHGRGSHGSMPQASIDPIVLASAIVMRLNAIVSRELAPDEFGIVTVGSLRAGSKSNVIPDRAELLLNIRSYDEGVRSRLKEAIERIVTAECQASGSPKDPEFEYYDEFPLTDNSPEVYEKVSAAFAEHFGDKRWDGDRTTGSEDFSDLPRAFGIPYLYWIFGGFDPETYRKGVEDGNLAKVMPGNHANNFVPDVEPTLKTGSEAMTVALLSYLAKD